MKVEKKRYKNFSISLLFCGAKVEKRKIYIERKAFPRVNFGKAKRSREKKKEK